MPPTNRERRVLVFAKAPRPGSAKTRLIPLLGAEGAAALHARLIKRTLNIVRRASLGAIELHGSPADDDFLRHCAASFGADLFEQQEGDLGARMARALSRALARGGSAILIGTDCPAMTARHLRRAAQVLDDGHDAVFVPTEDGGYALVGLARYDPRIFEGIAWSTSSVMRETRERLLLLGWRWAELETLWDVDLPADYDRLLAEGSLEPHARRAGDETSASGS
jgi:rSAM/selenodomain-associated transferase 1